MLIHDVFLYNVPKTFDKTVCSLFHFFLLFTTLSMNKFFFSTFFYIVLWSRIVTIFYHPRSSCVFSLFQVTSFITTSGWANSVYLADKGQQQSKVLTHRNFLILMVSIL